MLTSTSKIPVEESLHYDSGVNRAASSNFASITNKKLTDNFFFHVKPRALICATGTEELLNFSSKLPVSR